VAEQRATRIVFFNMGFGSSAWAALVPFAEARAEISDGALGLLLLCLGVGSIVTMPLSGALAAKLGCCRVIVAATLVVATTMPFLATLSAFQSLVLTLMLFGAGVGAIDVAMDIQAIIVERASGRSMMSGFHGLFSLGGIAGAGGMAALLSSGASPLVATLCVSLGVLVALALAATHPLPYSAKNEGPAFAIPHGRRCCMDGAGGAAGEADVGGLPVTDLWTPALPFKLNADRRHHIPKQKRKVMKSLGALLRSRPRMTPLCASAAV